MTLSIVNLSAGYGGIPVVSGISLKLAAGETGLVTGGNGSGKSTLLSAVAGLVDVYDGRVLVGAEDVSSVNPARRSMRVGYVPQERSLIDTLSPRDHARLNQRFVTFGGRRAMRTAVRDAVGAGWRRPVSVLSGGEKTLLNVLLVTDRRLPVYLFDEPFAGLAGAGERVAASHLSRVAADGAAVLVVEHRTGLPITVDREWRFDTLGRLEEVTP